MHRLCFQSALSSDATAEPNLRVCGRSLHVCWYMHIMFVFVCVYLFVFVYVHVCSCVCMCGVCVCVCVCVGYWGKKRKIVLDCGRRVPTSPRVAA